MYEQYKIILGGAWLALLVLALIFAAWRPWHRAGATWQIAARLFLGGWTTLAVLLALETGFFLYYDTTDSLAQSNVSRLWYDRHFHVNAQGFRDSKDFKLRAPAGVKRVILLGDSFAAGHGIVEVANRMGDILESSWNQSHEPKLQVYNYAFPALSTKQQIDVVRSLKQPGGKTDLVLLIYCLNDIEDLVPETRSMYVKMHATMPENLLIRTTYLPNLLYCRWMVFNVPEVRNYYGWLSTAYTESIWASQQQRFDVLRAACREIGARLMVVTFPFLNNLGPSYAFEDAHSKLKAYWQDHGVPYLDLLPTMREHRQEGLMINRFDAHPNERAHRLAAEAIMEYLRSQQTRLLVEPLPNGES